MSTAPLSEFLDTLRMAGVPVGLREYQDAVRLLVRFSRGGDTNLSQLRMALAARIGRTPSEVAHVEVLFEQFFAEVHSPPTEEACLPSRDDAKRPGNRLLIAIGIGVFLVLILGLLTLWLQPKSVNSAPTHKPTPVEPQEPPLPPPPIESAFNRMPELPPSPQIVHWWLRIGAVLALPLTIGALLFTLRRRRQLQHWAQQMRRRQLNGMAGPAEPRWPIEELLQSGLSASSLDDMATILGRGSGGEGLRLDVARTVQATARHGAMPRLHYRSQCQAQRIWVLMDISHDMRLWRWKTAGLIDGLRRRGVGLDVRYFDGVAGELAIAADASARPLDEVLRQASSSALIIISTGSEVADATGALASWIQELSQFEHRIWFNPIEDRALWRPPLLQRSFPMTVLPMTSAGLVAGAYALALSKEKQLSMREEKLFERRRASITDYERFKQILVLVQHPPFELAALLRQEFCPDLPEETLLHIIAEASDFSGRCLTFSPETASRLLKDLQNRERHQPPHERTEEQVRRFLLGLLHAAEPPSGTLAHLRWQLECAMQQVYLHDAVNKHVGQAIDTLQSLLMGPLFEEVHRRLGPLAIPGHARPRAVHAQPISEPVAREIGRRLGRLIGQPVGTLIPIPVRGSPTKAGNPELPAPPFWSWPDLLELSVTALGILICAGLAALSGIAAEKQLHQKAYAIHEEPTRSRESAALVIEGLKPELPDAVTLCSDASCKESTKPVQLISGRGRVEVMRREVHSYYHVRSRLPKGNIAYSDMIQVERLTPPMVFPVEPLPEATGSLLLTFVSLHNNRPIDEVVYRLIDETGHQEGGIGGQAKQTKSGKIKVIVNVWGYEPKHFTLTLKPREEHIEQIALLPRHVADLPTVTSNSRSKRTISESPMNYDASSAQPADMNLPSDLAVPSVQLNASKTPKSEPVREIKLGKMIWISGSKFKMGSDDSSYQDESPAHDVTVTGFWIDETEVTVNAYQDCIDVGACTPSGNGDKCNAPNGQALHPINCVTWHQAQRYCLWAKKRLPTEAEWEFTARGAEGREYPWGKASPGRRLCWLRNQGTCEVKTHSEGQTAHGIYDLAGNVWEWVQDLHRKCYAADCETDFGYVIRGGSWRSENFHLVRGALRGRESGTNWSNDIGFRCVRSASYEKN